MNSEYHDSEDASERANMPQGESLPNTKPQLQADCEATIQQPHCESVYLLFCPDCGDQKKITRSQIGDASQCECGVKYRVTLSLVAIGTTAHSWGPRRSSFLASQRLVVVSFWSTVVQPSARTAMGYTRGVLIPLVKSNLAMGWQRLSSLAARAMDYLHTPIEIRETDTTQSDCQVTSRTASPEHMEAEKQAGLAGPPSPTTVASPTQSVLKPLMPVSSVAQNDRLSRKSDDSVCCPTCGSTNIHAEKRGWNIWLGFIGSGTIVITCLKCGRRFKPG